MSITDDDLDNWFTYHAPTPDQIGKYKDLRDAARAFAEAIRAHTPPCADQTGSDSEDPRGRDDGERCHRLRGQVMGEEVIGGNGAPPASEGKPIVITLTLFPTPHGYAIQVGHDPSIFEDQIIDACHRAARFYERVAMLREMQAMEAKAQQARAQMQRIQGRIGLS